jgi:hypothetical protein
MKFNDMNERSAVPLPFYLRIAGLCGSDIFRKSFHFFRFFRFFRFFPNAPSQPFEWPQSIQSKLEQIEVAANQLVRSGSQASVLHVDIFFIALTILFSPN